jgi:hypothetical protein
MNRDDLIIFYQGRRSTISLTDARRVKNEDESERWEFSFDFQPSTTERDALNFELKLQKLGIQLGASNYAAELRGMLLTVWNARGVEDSKLAERLRDGDSKTSDVIRDILRLSV